MAETRTENLAPVLVFLSFTARYSHATATGITPISIDLPSRPTIVWLFPVLA
jgi:hypothetical protein